MYRRWTQGTQLFEENEDHIKQAVTHMSDVAIKFVENKEGVEGNRPRL
jgi:hypothetical protein